MTKAPSENPNIELLLYSGTFHSLIANLRFLINIRRGAVQLLLGAAAIMQMWLVIGNVVDRSTAAATGVALVILVILDLFEWLKFSGGPASTAYIEAAMRHVYPADRLELLAQIDTVALRGELVPVSMARMVDIFTKLKQTKARKVSEEHLRQSRHARLQAALIDAYRSV
jgi:hypothetical protein